jgi:hypothetical protein
LSVAKKSSILKKLSGLSDTKHTRPNNCSPLFSLFKFSSLPT